METIAKIFSPVWPESLPVLIKNFKTVFICSFSIFWLKICVWIHNWIKWIWTRTLLEAIPLYCRLFEEDSTASVDIRRAETGRGHHSRIPPTQGMDQTPCISFLYNIWGPCSKSAPIGSRVMFAKNSKVIYENIRGNFRREKKMLTFAKV